MASRTDTLCGIATNHDNDTLAMPSSAVTSPQTPLEIVRDALLVTYRDARAWQRDSNILGFYRTPSNSYQASCKSLCYIHNQSGNVLSHIIGVALFAIWGHQQWQYMARHDASMGDYLIFGCYLVAAMCCFGFTSLFHLFSDHSSSARQTWMLADLYGVFALVTATVFSGTFYGFYCDQKWWAFYSAGVSRSLHNADGGKYPLTRM